MKLEKLDRVLMGSGIKLSPKALEVFWLIIHGTLKEGKDRLSLMNRSLSEKVSVDRNKTLPGLLEELRGEDLIKKTPVGRWGRGMPWVATRKGLRYYFMSERPTTLVNEPGEPDAAARTILTRLNILEERVLGAIQEGPARAGRGAASSSTDETLIRWYGHNVLYQGFRRFSFAHDLLRADRYLSAVGELKVTAREFAAVEAPPGMRRAVDELMHGHYLGPLDVARGAAESARRLEILVDAVMYRAGLDEALSILDRNEKPAHLQSPDDPEYHFGRLSSYLPDFHPVALRGRAGLVTELALSSPRARDLLHPMFVEHWAGSEDAIREAFFKPMDKKFLEEWGRTVQTDVLEPHATGVWNLGSRLYLLSELAELPDFLNRVLMFVGLDGSDDAPEP